MSDVWYYAKDQKTFGPISLAELGAVLSHAPSNNRGLVWRNGFPSWVRAEDAKELVPFMVGPPPLPTGATDPVLSLPHSNRLNSWLVGAICGCVIWSTASYAFYRYISIMNVLLAIISVAAIVIAVWLRRYKLSFGFAVGIAMGAAIAIMIVNHRLDLDKAIALGFSSVSDMREAQNSNLTPQQLAERRAVEAQKAAAAERERRKQEAAEAACRRDWSKCADNSEIVNKYSDWTIVQIRCQRAASEQARYGDPEWPSFSFGTYLKGNAYVKTGMAIAIERDARFQNGFGAKVHSEVICKYDLRAQKVINVNIGPR